MPGRFCEKLRKQFQDTQKVPFVLDKTRKPLFPNWKPKTFFEKKKDFFQMSHSAENPKESSMLERFHFS